jgi:hypothetical protein
MLKSGKKICALRDKKNKYSNSCVVRRKISERNKKPLFRRQQLYCAFIDYRKALASVNRVLLWQQLLRTGIDGKILTVIQNLYKSAKSCVRDGDTYSK